MKHYKRLNSKERAKKLDERTFYNIRSIIGLNWASFFALIGGRQTGKSYSVMDFFLKEFFKYGTDFVWLRLTEPSKRKLLKNNAYDFVDPDLVRKYNLNLKVKGDNVFNVSINEKGKKEERLMARILCLSTFYNEKGIGYFDKDRIGRFNIALDEMNRESNEKNTFDITYAFVNMMENLIRNTKRDKDHILRIFLLGNTLQEASDLMTCFNFLPEKFGRFNVRKKRLVVEYLPNSKAYQEMRKDSVADLLSNESSTFSNKVDFDLKLIDKSKLIKPSCIIKFSDEKDTWYTIWNGNIVHKYNNEKIDNCIYMRPYMNEGTYIKDKVQKVVSMFDMRYLRFHTLIIMRMFKRELAMIRKG